MNSFYDEHVSSDASYFDSDDQHSYVSPSRIFHTRNVNSTPKSIYKPRVDFRSIESLAQSSSKVSLIAFSPLTLQRNDETGYSSLNTSASVTEKDNYNQSTTQLVCKDRKNRRKLSDWQTWHLRQFYSQNRYPSLEHLESLATQLNLPISSVRIWFQNYRARSGKK